MEEGLREDLRGRGEGHTSFPAWLERSPLEHHGLVILTAALVLLLEKLGDPLSLNDASVTVLSAIATVWLVKSYPGQWILWIIADILSTLLCARSGMVWMTVLYVAYTLSAVYGLYHWLKNGRYIE